MSNIKDVQKRTSIKLWRYIYMWFDGNVSSEEVFDRFAKDHEERSGNKHA